MKKLFLLLLLFTACSTGTMLKTGYLVSVEDTELSMERTETTKEADAFILQKTNLKFDTDVLIGTDKAFWGFQNENYYIYVEKQGLYQRSEKGKKRWKVYDLKLDNARK